MVRRIHTRKIFLKENQTKFLAQVANRALKGYKPADLVVGGRRVIVTKDEAFFPDTKEKFKPIAVAARGKELVFIKPLTKRKVI